VPCEVAHKTNDFAGEAIIEAARTHGCDCIFMASHGRSGRRGPMLGSETQKVVNQASVPVVIYRVEAAG
jgi:nucleotide-binding universal stress UspA family protein